MCEALHFRGNVAGAWREFDADFGGFITLEELDKSARAGGLRQVEGGAHSRSLSPSCLLQKPSEAPIRGLYRFLPVYTYAVRDLCSAVTPQ